MTDPREPFETDSAVEGTDLDDARADVRGSADLETGAGETGSAEGSSDTADQDTDTGSADAVPEGVDRAGDVVTGHVRQLDRDGEETAAHAGVGGAERRGRHPHPHLTGAGDGLVDVLVPQDLGTAHLVETHCLHVWTCLRWMCRWVPCRPNVAGPGAISLGRIGPP